MDVKSISLTAVFASLYAVLLVSMAPFSFGPIQLRVADCLLPLAALFGWPIIWGATIGCLIGNAVGGVIAFGMINATDIVYGSFANLLATYAIFRLRRHRLLGCMSGALIIGFIVGGYLWNFVEPPSICGLSMSAWVAMTFSLTISSLIAVAGIGYILLTMFNRPAIVDLIKSRGLKVYTES